MSDKTHNCRNMINHGAFAFRALALIAACSTVMFLVTACATQNPRSHSRRSGSNSRRSSGPFSAQYVPHLRNPEVVVENKSSKIITLSLSGGTSRTLSISPFATESVSVPAGRYTYHASAPGVMPVTGVNSFDQHYRYTWIFSIRTVTY